MEANKPEAGTISVPEKIGCLKLRIVIHPAEEGGFWAEVPGFPGCVSEGDTLQEIRFNIREAFEGVLGVIQDRAEIHPEDSTPNDLVEELVL
jgi:predicted RNase H-like HicB family nuclease